MEATALGNSLLIDDRYSEAISAYEPAKAEVPEAAANLVLALVRSGAVSDAVVAGELSRSMHPQHPLITFRYAQALFYADKFAQAVDLFRELGDFLQAKSFVGKCDKELSRTAGGKYTWFQTETNVVLEIPVKVASQEQCRVDADDYRVDITALTTSGHEYHLALPLLQAIDASATQCKVTPSHLEITLRKKSAVNWVAIEPSALAQPLKYPSSKQKDWSRVDVEIEKELKKEKPEGDEALMSLFRQIYENGDENTRKAMIKSFQTSSGTVLSTNWGEVAEKDYEGKDRPSAPNGQEWAPKEP